MNRITSTRSHILRCYFRVIRELSRDDQTGKLLNDYLISIEPGVEIIWKVISFFASEPERQMSMIGPAEDWFSEEDSRINPGANYLMGMSIAYAEYRLFMFDMVYDPDDETHTMILENIYDQIDNMWKKDCWSVHALAEDEDWRHLRELSQKALASYGFELNPPSEPFRFPDIFHIDHWGDPEGRIKEKKD